MTACLLKKEHIGLLNLLGKHESYLWVSKILMNFKHTIACDQGMCGIKGIHWKIL